MRKGKTSKKNTKKMHFLPNNTQQKKINKISRIILWMNLSLNQL